MSAMLIPSWFKIVLLIIQKERGMIPRTHQGFGPTCKRVVRASRMPAIARVTRAPPQRQTSRVAAKGVWGAHVPPALTLLKSIL